MGKWGDKHKWVLFMANKNKKSQHPTRKYISVIVMIITSHPDDKKKKQKVELKAKEKWKMKMKNEKWKMKNEKWKMKNEKWKMKKKQKEKMRIDETLTWLEMSKGESWKRRTRTKRKVAWFPSSSQGDRHERRRKKKRKKVCMAGVGKR